jgi:site-specific DNA-methyltransferase (adenine-specific)
MTTDLTPWQRVRAEADRALVVCGDAVEVLYQLEPESIDVVFADPPYFLSRSGGTTCKGGKSVSVVKGDWDKPRARDQAIAFSTCWLAAVQRVLKPSGTAWVSGTKHIIRAVSAAAEALRMPEINEVVWRKPNPPPNLSTRTLTHSHEEVLWLKREPKAPYHFDYQRSREIAGDAQLKDVWEMQPPRGDERKRGNGHTTQKPVELVRRCLEVSCPAGGLVLDPFAGSGTTGEAALALGMRVVLIDADPESYERCLRRVGR